MRTDICFIVPIYKGRQFVLPMCRQIEECAKNVDSKIQLHIINDYPEELIDSILTTERTNVTYSNNVTNIGIHKSRVKGLQETQSEYVVFLDQDDKISPDYLVSQIDKIELSNADVSICGAIEGSKEVYDDVNKLEYVSNLEYMTGKQNYAVSPGQALIKRDAIPVEWIEADLKKNGADDWLLWLCLLAKNKKIEPNSRNLFEHVVNGKNASWNSLEMISSQEEVVHYIQDKCVLEEHYIQNLNMLVQNERNRYISFLDKYRNNYLILDKWISFEGKKSFKDYLKENRWLRVAVYGDGMLGHVLIQYLLNDKSNDVECVGVIDKDFNKINERIPAYSLESFEEDVDLIIVTILSMTEDVLRQIQEKKKCEVKRLDELILNRNL